MAMVASTSIEQQTGQAHHQHLVGDAVNMPERTDQAFDHSANPI
jgi:hypothetical protein